MVDVFGKDANELRLKKLWLFDMDGTIYEEDRLFDGALQLLDLIKKRKGEFVFITNNSSRSLEDYIKKVAGLGIEATKDNFFTSVQASALLLKEKHPNQKIYCQGTKSFVNELKECQINVTENPDDDVQVVIVGFDTELTSEKLRKTCSLLTKNVSYYATNCDLRCPVSFGYIPDCGSICQMIENCTNRAPVFIGKPASTMVDIARQKYGMTLEQTVVVGDRLYTDIASGNNAGVTSVCVLTGEANINDIISGAIKPTYTFESVQEIAEIIR